jgi:uncharacterized protein (DUF58 family)
MTFSLFDESFLLKLERLSVMSRRAMAGQLQGERRSPKRGQSVEFADFRPYAPGDDFRRIDWNAYARLERFFLKLFVEEEDLTVHILVDASPSMDWGTPNKLAYALRVAGALGYIAMAGLDRLTVSILGKESYAGNGAAGRQPVFPVYFSPHRGKSSAQALFSFLQSHLPADQPSNLPTLQPSTPPVIHIQSYAARAASPGPLIFISDLFESTLPIHRSSNLPTFQAALNALAAKGFEVTLLHTLSSDERRPELSGDLRLLDQEGGTEVEITADYDLLQRYTNGLAGWQNEWRTFCGARGMHYIPLETTLPLEELLFAWLRQYAVLK